VPRTGPSLLIALGVLTIGTASAAAQDPPPEVYGGGVIVERAPQADLAATVPSTAIGLRRVGGHVVVRLSIALRCGRYHGGDYRATDVVANVPLKPDGTFAVSAKAVRTVELGRVRLTISGMLAADRADGTARVRSHFPCGGQDRNWTARPVTISKVPAETPPTPADGVLYGVTGEPATAPHGFVARVSMGATVFHAFTSYTTDCHGRDHGRAYHSAPVVQQILPERPLTAGVVDYAEHTTETAAERRHGIDVFSELTYDGAFSGPVFVGYLAERQRYRNPTRTQRCASGTNTIIAKP
jgi:hypothetical protein